MKIRRLVELGLKAKGRQAMTEIDAQRDRDIYDLIGSFTEKSMSDIQVRFDGLKNSGLQFADLENLQRDIMSEPSRDGEDVRAKDAVLKIMELIDEHDRTAASSNLAAAFMVANALIVTGVMERAKPFKD